MKRYAILLTGLMLLAVPAVAKASCVATPPHETTIEVDSCERIIQDRVPRVEEFRKRYAQAFVPDRRAEYQQQADKVAESYRGAIVRVQSEGQLIPYFLPSNNLNICDHYKKGIVVQVTIDKACCDGDPNPPCYLGFSQFITQTSVDIRETHR